MIEMFGSTDINPEMKIEDISQLLVHKVLKIMEILIIVHHQNHQKAEMLHRINNTLLLH